MDPRYFIYTCLSDERKALITKLGERAAERLAEVTTLEEVALDEESASAASAAGERAASRMDTPSGGEGGASDGFVSAATSTPSRPSREAPRASRGDWEPEEEEGEEGDRHVPALGERTASGEFGPPAAKTAKASSVVAAKSPASSLHSSRQPASPAWESDEGAGPRAASQEGPETDGEIEEIELADDERESGEELDSHNTIPDRAKLKLLTRYMCVVRLVAGFLGNTAKSRAHSWQDSLRLVVAWRFLTRPLLPSFPRLMHGIIARYLVQLYLLVVIIILVYQAWKNDNSPALNVVLEVLNFTVMLGLTFTFRLRASNPYFVLTDYDEFDGVAGGIGSLGAGRAVEMNQFGSTTRMASRSWAGVPRLRILSSRSVKASADPPLPPAQMGTLSPQTLGFSEPGTTLAHHSGTYVAGSSSGSEEELVVASPPHRRRTLRRPHAP